MRVLIITKKFPFPVKDGESIVINSLARLLSHNNYDIDLFALNTSKHYFSIDRTDRFEELSHFGHIHTAYLDNKLYWSHALLNLLTSEPYHVSRYYDVRVSERLKAVMQKINYDLIQLEGLQLMVYFDMIKSVTNAPVVLRAHNREHQIWKRIIRGVNNPFKKLYLKIQSERLRDFETKSITMADGIMAISQNDALWFQSFNPNISVIPFVLNSRPFPVSEFSISLGKPLRLGFIGSLDWEPNIEALDIFFEKVHKTYEESTRPYKLFVAGRNGSDKIRLMCQSYSAEYLGELEDAELFWRNIDVLIVPILSGSGIRIKILEAMIRGKIVISTSVGIEGIMVKANKEAIVEDDFNVWKSRIGDIAEFPESYKLMSSDGKKYVEKNYSEKIIFKLITEFYARLRLGIR